MGFSIFNFSVIDLKSGLVGINKFDKFIYGELEMRSGGDWSNYDEGDLISYDFELLEKCDDEELCYIDDYNLDRDEEDKVLLNDLKEYVGEGICYVLFNDEDNWYNVEFVDDVMVVSFICMEKY